MATTTDRRTVGVKLITPVGVVFDDQATMVVVPGAAGELGLLARHEPLVAALRFGETRVHLADESVLHFATSEGYVSIGDDQVHILVEQAEARDTLDVARAEDALRRAKEGLEAASDDAERAFHEAAVRRNENRLKVAQKGK